MENKNLNIINMSDTVAKRKATILKKREMKEAKKAAYHSKREDKYILAAGDAFFNEKSKVNEKFRSGFYLTAKFTTRTLWYKRETDVFIDDKNANKLTNLYLNKYNSNDFSLYEDPKFYEHYVKKGGYLAIDTDDPPDKREIAQKNMVQMIEYQKLVTGKGQYFTHEEYSKFYYAVDINEAKQLITQDILEDYRANDDYKRIDVVSFEKIAVVEDVKPTKKDIKQMKMKNAHPLKYPELIGNIEDEVKNDGFCVYNNFLSTYKHVSEDEFIKLCSFIEPVIDKSDGITPDQLHYVCKKKDISHYAFDVTKKCFLKYVSKNRNYQALVYYAINNHMYHVKNPETALSLIKSAVDIETKINSIYFEQEESTNIFSSELEIKENINIKELLTYNESCIVIYPHKHLNDQLIELINNNIKPAIKRCKKTMINYMVVDKTKNIKFYLFADENDHTQNINYKTVKSLCDSNEIEFKNQTFTTVIKQIKDKHIIQKQKRVEFTKEFRKEFFIKNCHCNNPECNKVLKKGDREIDHIIPISQDGSPTDIKNLQALCKECHFDKTQDDINDDNIKVSKTHSSFSNSVDKVMSSNLNKSWAFVEKVTHSDKFFDDADDEFEYDPEEDIDVVLEKEKQWELSRVNKPKKEIKSSSLDINGSRRNKLRHNKFDFPLYTVLDQFEVYNGQTAPGKYYVETLNYMPLRGNGLYFYPTIKHCLENNIIEESDIKYCILSSLTTPHDYFNDFIDFCVDKIENYKLAINSLIGSFAVNKQSKFWKSLIITEDLSEAYNYFYNNNGVFIDMKESERGNFYNVFLESNLLNVETERIIYDMIIELEAIELHKLKLIIESKGAQVTEYKTDSIRFNYINEFPFQMLDEKNIDGYFYSDGLPMYKVETKGELLQEMKSGYLRTDVFKYEKSDFNIISDVEDNDFKPLIEKIINSNGCSIQGVAGSGKSNLINNLVKEIRNNKQDCTILTPTNLSSIIINGMTLDKFYKKVRSVEILQNLVKDYIIVDEVSMMKEVFYKMLCVIKAYKPTVKIILVGHDLQFSPVKDRIGERQTSYYFNSDVFHELVDGNKLLLTKCRRSDDRHYKNCCDVQNVNINEYGNKIAHFNICYTNNKRIEINKILMDRAKEKNKTSKEVCLDLLKYTYSKNSQDVYLTLKTPVIAIKNKKEINLINSEMYIIKEIDKVNNIIIVKNDNKEIDVPINKFQQWFHVAYCITAHKSQGQTIKKSYTIHDWHLMDKTCKYVSLSRASSFENVNIIL